MKYPNIYAGKFISRPNRFIANIEIDGKQEVCHVKNTGRCAELFIPGTTVYCTHNDSPARKTKWDVVAVDRGDILFNIDSQSPNKVFEEFVRDGKFDGNWDEIRPEFTYDKSRFDFMLRKGSFTKFIEIKGVTLERAGVLFFPDAPTERGVKHINELIKAKSAGYGAAICFVLQMENAKVLRPNYATHPAFGEALKAAKAAGVEILAYDCNVKPDEITIANAAKVIL